MREGHFVLQRTRAEGEPEGEPRRIDWRDRRALLLDWPYSPQKLAHLCELACAAPGAPGVDITQFSDDGERLLYSARLAYFPAPN